MDSLKSATNSIFGLVLLCLVLLGIMTVRQALTDKSVAQELSVIPLSEEEYTSISTNSVISDYDKVTYKFRVYSGVTGTIKGYKVIGYEVLIPDVVDNLLLLIDTDFKLLYTETRWTFRKYYSSSRTIDNNTKRRNKLISNLSNTPYEVVLYNDVYIQLEEIIYK